jgi:tetratricopeptide (TPR) repeat protein
MCNAQFERILADEAAFPDLPSKIKAWEAKKTDCGGTGLYEFRLANLHTQAGNYSVAESVLKTSLAKKLPYERELSLGLADIQLAKHNWVIAERDFRELIKKYPDWHVGYQKVGTVKFEEKKYEESIYFHNEANKRQHSPTSYLELTLSYHQLAQHENAIKSMNKAFSLDKTVAGDRDAMLATAISYASVGKYKLSRNLLAMLLNARPETKNDPGYKQALEFLRKRMDEAGVKIEDLD